MSVAKGSLSHRARSGVDVSVRVAPGAQHNSVVEGEDGTLAVQVTAPPSGGQANVAVQKTLARALGLAKSRVVLLRGASSRNKVFRIA